jgi:hypothetical protein
MLITAIREVQIPLLAALLLGGCAAKLVRVLRVGSVDAGLGPTALFPMRLRRPVAITMLATEFGLGAGLIVTSGSLLAPWAAATAVRLGTGVLFLVATCALIELRSARPDVGCGCFGDLSTSPASVRTLIRAALLAAAAFATIGLPPLRLPQPGSRAVLIGILLAELLVIGALSPELGEGLVRLGYSEPCELRRLAEHRTLSALHRSRQWRRHSRLITAGRPVDVWREMCWRYVVFPGRDGTEVVFAVHLRPRRPPVHAALVDAVTGELLPWPARRIRRPLRTVLAGLAGLAGPGRQITLGRPGLTEHGPERPARERVLAAPTLTPTRMPTSASTPTLRPPPTRPARGGDMPGSTGL